MPSPRTKLHQIHYLPKSASADGNIVAVSTEDGRVLFYSTYTEPEDDNANSDKASPSTPLCKLLGTIGGLEIGLAGRVKDFEVLQVPTSKGDRTLIITGSSDGAVRLWLLDTMRLSKGVVSDGQAIDGKKKAESIKAPKESTDNVTEQAQLNNTQSSTQVGILLGTCETGNRIMCLKAFELIGEPEAADAMQANLQDEDGDGAAESGEEEEESNEEE